MHINNIGLRIEMIIPDIFQKHGARHHLARVLHQVFQQAELARLQRQLFLAARHAMRQPIELKVAYAVSRVLGRAAAAARQYFYSRQQFGEGIWLWQIVVTTGAQALDAVVDLSERRKNENGGAVALLAQSADQ